MGTVLFSLLLAIGASPARASGPYEPNDSIAAATGPLSGGVTYSAARETANDEDWFYFYTNGAQQFDVAFTNLGSECTNLLMELKDADGEELASVRPDFNETRHIAYSSPAAAKYYLRVFDLLDESCSYQLRLEPAAAITTVAPPPPAPESTPASKPSSPDRSTIRAKKECEHARGHVAGLRRKLRHARGAHYRAAIRRDLRRARARVKRVCR
ncbi:MAG TPA: PPC domain-containing protein [Solirubrobacterales bacterium]